MTNFLRLADVSEINPRLENASSFSPDSKTSFVPMAAISEVSGSIVLEEERPLREVSKGFTYFQNDDVLVAKITPCFENGKIAHAKIKNELGFGSTEFHVVRANASFLDSRYLYHFLRQKRIRIEGERKMTGSAGQRRIPKNFIENLTIPLPPLPEQRRIAAILDKADAMRELRRQSIAKLDTLLKAIFLEMFGDPTRNPMGWATYPLGQISEVQGGLQLTPKRAENPLELPYLRVANVYRDRLLLEDIKFIKVTEEERDRVALQKDDILLVEGHGNREEIGRTAIWDGSIAPCVHQNHLIRIRLNPVIANPIYVNAYLNSQGGRRQLFRFGKTTSGLNTINISNVKSTLILLPPVSLQCQFAELAMRQQRLRNRLTQQSESMNRLFNGLQQRAFSGQLFTEKAAAAAQQELFAD